MSNYIGYRCPVCGKAFVQGDDIVVCPDCGAPHHRACYKDLGHCAFEDKHASGRQWAPKEEAAPNGPDTAQNQTTVVCSRCGSHNPASNIFCQVCGNPLSAGEAPSQNPGPNRQSPWEFPGGPAYRREDDAYSQGGYRPQDGQGQYQDSDPFFSPFSQAQPDYTQELAPGISMKEVCDYVGPNSWSFAMKFTALTRSGGFSLNWSAFFFSFFYCFYRKMYKLGGILLAIAVASMLPVFWFAYPYFTEIWTQYGTLTVDALTTFTSPASQNFAMATMAFRTTMFFISAFCALFFNRAYLREVCRNIRAMQKNGHYSSGSPEYNYALARRGGVNSNAVLVLVCTLMVAYIGACVWLTYHLM